jgi:hypothetical protein
MRLKHLFAAVAACGLLLALSGPAQASLSLVTSRSALGGTDFIDWGQLGGPFTVVPGPVNVVSNLGVVVGVNDAGNIMERRDQGNGWAGNFAPGDHLLWTQGANGPITLTFSLNGVTAIGSQIQANFFGPFTAQISAYDSSHTLLGTFSEAGNSTPNGDNSAIFIGVRSSSANIFTLVLAVPVASFNPEDMAINRVDFSSQPVPEPSTLVSLGVMGLCAAGFGLRRRVLAAR